MLASENIDSTIGVDPITQIQTELRDYSALLEKTENGAVLSKQLAQLSEDIVECPSVWEKVDLRNVISTAAFTEAIKDQSRNRFDWHAFWELLRNILVLFPVLLTWLALSDATIKYTEAIRRDPTMAEKNFIFLWQEGFGNPAANWMTFSNVAALDGLLIFGIAVLTIMIVVTGLRKESRLNREIAQKSVHFDALLWKAQRLLYTKNHKENKVENQLVELISQANRSLTQIETRSKDIDLLIEKESARLSSYASLRDKEIKSLQDFGSQLGKNTAQFNKSSEVFSRSFDTIDRSMDTLLKGITSLSGLQNTANDNLTQMVSQIGSVGQAIASLNGVHVNTMEELRRDLTATSQQVSKVAISVSSLDVTIRALALEQREFQNMLVDETSNREKWITQVNKSITTMADFGTNLKVLENVLQSSIVNLNQVSNDTMQASKRIEDLLEHIDEVNKQVIVVEQMGNQIHNSIQQSNRSIASVDHTTAELKNALAVLNASQQMIAESTKNSSLSLKQFTDENKTLVNLLQEKVDTTNHQKTGFNLFRRS